MVISLEVAALSPVFTLQHPLDEATWGVTARVFYPQHVGLRLEPDALAMISRQEGNTNGEGTITRRQFKHQS
jgi:hypothetical protein